MRFMIKQGIRPSILTSTVNANTYKKKFLSIENQKNNQQKQQQ